MRTRKKWIRMASFLMAFLMFIMPVTDAFAEGHGTNAYSSSAPGSSYRYLGQRLYLVEYIPSKGADSIGVKDWLCSKQQKVIAINRHYMAKTKGNSEDTYNKHIQIANGSFGMGWHTYTSIYPKIKAAFGKKALETMKAGVKKGYQYAVVLEGWGAYAGGGKLKYTPSGAIFYYTFKGDGGWRQGKNSWYSLCHFRKKDLGSNDLAEEKYGLAPSFRDDFHLVTTVPKVPGGKGCNPRWVYDMLWDTMNDSYYDPISGKTSKSHHIRGYVVYTFKAPSNNNKVKAETSLRVYDHDEAGNWNSQARSYAEYYKVDKGTSNNYFAQAVTNTYTSVDNKKLTRNETYNKGTERKTSSMPPINDKLGDAGVPSEPSTSHGYLLMQADGTPLVSIGEALAGSAEKKRDYKVWFTETADASVTAETVPLGLQDAIDDDADAGDDANDIDSASKTADEESTEEDTVKDDTNSPDALGKQSGSPSSDIDDVDDADAKNSDIEETDETATESAISNTAFAKDDEDSVNETDIKEEQEAEAENFAERATDNSVTVYGAEPGTPFGHKWVAKGIKSSDSDTLYTNSKIWELFKKNANSVEGAEPCVGGKSVKGGSATLYQASLDSTLLALSRLSNEFKKDNYKKTYVKDDKYKIGTSSKYMYMKDKVHYYIYTIVADTQRINLQSSFTGDVSIKKREQEGTSVGFTRIKNVPAGSKVIAVSNVDTDKKDGEASLIKGVSDLKSHTESKSVFDIYKWLQSLASKQYTVPNSGGKKANLGETKAIMQTSNGSIIAGCTDNFAGDDASGNVGYTFVVFETNEVKTESDESLQDYELNRYFPSAFTVEHYDEKNFGLGSVFKTYQPPVPSVTWSHHGLDNPHDVHEHDHVHSWTDSKGNSHSVTVHNHDGSPSDWVSAPVEFKYSGESKAQTYDEKRGNKGQFIARYDHCDTAHGLMTYSGDYPYATATGRVIDLTTTPPYQFDWGHMLARNMAGDKRTVSSLAYKSAENSGEGFKVGSKLSKALELEYGDTAKTTSGATVKRDSNAIANGGTWAYTFSYTAKHLHEGAYKPKVKRCFSLTICSWCGAVVCKKGCDVGEVTIDFTLSRYYTLNGGPRASWAPKLHMTVYKYLEDNQGAGVSPMKDGIQSRLEHSDGSFKHSVDKLAQNKTASKSNEFGYVYYENFGDSSIGTKAITDKFVPEVLMRVEKATGDFTNAKATGIWTMGEKERATKPIAFYLFKIKNDEREAASGKTRGNTAATGNSANGNNRATYTTGSDISIKAKVKAEGYMYGYALDQISTNEDKSKWTGISYNTQIPSGKLPTWGNDNISTLKNDFTDWVKEVSNKKNYQADFVMSIKKANGSPIRYNGFSASLGKFSKPVSDGEGVKYTNAYPLTFRFGELQTEGKAGEGYRAMLDQIKKDYGDTTRTECSEETAKQIFKDSGIEQAIFDSVQSAKASENKSQNGAGNNTNLGKGYDRTGVTDNGKFLTKSRTLGTKNHWYDEAVRTFVVRRFTTDKPLNFGTVMASDKVDYDNADDSGNSTHDAWFNFNLYFNYNKGDNKIRGIKQLFNNKSDFYNRKGSVADNASKTKNVIINNTFVDGSEFNITSTTTNSMGW